jgi:large subunit ribosomal protein L4
VADKPDKTQNTAAGEGAPDKPVKPARAPRKAPVKATADKPAAGAKRSAKVAAEAPAAKPARRRAKPAVTEAVAAETAAVETTDSAAPTDAPAPAKPARKRAATAKAAPKVAKPAKPAAAPAKPARKAKSAPAVERAAVRRPADERVALVFDADGKQVDEIKLSVERFGLTADINLLHLAVRAEQAARRSGSASTKTRGEISGSTAKLYRQKGTGRARAGSVKSPTRSGGGTAFGPKPRSYDLKINRKAAHKALTMALSDRAEGGSIYVARGLDLEAPSTATVNELLMALDIAAPVLVVTDDEPVVARSVRNLRYAETGEARRLSVEQVLRNRSIVVTEKAFSVLTGA